MLWLGIMVLLILWLLGYGYEVGGNGIHLLLAAVVVLLVSTLFRSNPTISHRQQSSGESLKGKINWANPERQWGFIKCEDGSDVYFEGSSFDCSEEEGLQEGDKVEFTVEPPPSLTRFARIKVLRRCA